MKTIMNSFLLVLFVLSTASMQSAQAAQDAQRVPKAMTPEVMIDKFVKKLKGIELYFMLGAINDKTVTLQKMAALMAYRTGKVPQSIEMMLPKRKEGEPPSEDGFPYQINKINRKAGYMSMSKTLTEGSLDMTYWNIDKSRKVVGYLYYTCTMLCDDYSLSFALFRDGKAEPYYPVELPDGMYRNEDLAKLEFFVRDKNEADALSKDIGWHAEVKLPEKGTDITIVLGIESVKGIPDSDTEAIMAFVHKKLRGTCTKLIWHKKRGKFTVAPPTFCY